MIAPSVRPPRPAASRLAVASAMLGLLAGCASNAGYPSLAPRAAEGATEADKIAVPPSALGDAALDAQVAVLAAQAASGHAAFEKAAGGACAAVVRGAKAAQGSEAWIAAQQAISGLDTARAPVLAAVAELDRLVIERGTATGPAVDLSQLAAAQEQASALDVAEQARVAALSAGKCAV
jgi:hypothetical protein